MLFRSDENGDRVQGSDGRDIWIEVEETQLLPVDIITAGTASSGAGLDVDSLGLDTPTLVALATMAQATDDATFMVEVAKGHAGNTALMTAVTKDVTGTRKALADAII